MSVVCTVRVTGFEPARYKAEHFKCSVAAITPHPQARNFTWTFLDHKPFAAYAKAAVIVAIRVEPAAIAMMRLTIKSPP